MSWLSILANKTKTPWKPQKNNSLKDTKYQTVN